MNETFEIGSRVKILRKPENGGGFTEVGRGKVIGNSSGRGEWIKFVEFIDGNFQNIDAALAETIPVDAPCMRVVKW